MSQKEDKNIKNYHPKIRYGSKLELDDTLKSLVLENNIEFDKDSNLVMLTKRNSIIIENLIKEDDSYIPFAEMIYKELCNENNGSFPNTPKAWTTLIRIIDIDNSTQVYKFHRNDFYKIIDYITNPSNNFIENLKVGKISLVDKLMNSMQSTNIKSLPSKICKFASEYMGFGDNYFINDYYIRSMLPYYIKHYNVEWNPEYGEEYLKVKTHREELKYKVLFNYLNALLEKINENEEEPLTKSELDHIIWYCYKSYNRD